MTDGSYAAVASEDLVADVAGIGTEAPLVDAVVAAESAASFGEDFEVAPAAEGQVIGAARQGLARSAASGESAGG